MNVHDQMRMLRVGVVGCGAVAHHHMRAVANVSFAQIVSLADIDYERLQRVAHQYDVQHTYTSLEAMLRSTPLDVLHVLTPPACHYEHTKTALEHGIHVLVEKPVAFTARQVSDLYRRAEAQRLCLCPSFPQLYHPRMSQARRIIRSGRLGPIRHVDIQMRLERQTRPELHEHVGVHWAHQLPGGVLHNHITHPLYLALYFLGSAERVCAHGSSHGIFSKQLPDHLTIMLHSHTGTASCVLSLATTPEHYAATLLCEGGSVVVNFSTSCLAVTRGQSLPRVLQRGTADLIMACQLAAETGRNIVRYMRGQMVPYAGLHILVEQFYRRILKAEAPPVPEALTLAVAQAEEAVVRQLEKVHVETPDRPSRQQNVRQRDRVLVTGATGYLGSHVTRELVGQGYYVRALVRPLSHTQSLERLGVELVSGDVRDLKSVACAAENVDVIVHMAAGTRGTTGFILDTCVVGTSNVAEAAVRNEVRRVIYMSSMSVYDYQRARTGEVINHHSALEERPELRGVYSLAKRRAEDIALACVRRGMPAWTILRPSMIVGNGWKVWTPVGVRYGEWLFCPGTSRRRLELVHVEDVAAAVMDVLQNESTRGQVFVLSDPEAITVRDYIQACIRGSPGTSWRVVCVPRLLLSIGAAAGMVLRSVTGRGPHLNMRRVRYGCREIRVDSGAILERVGWRPAGELLQRLADECRRGQVATERAAEGPPTA